MTAQKISDELDQEPATIDIPGVTRPMTYEEYLDSPEEMRRYDIIDGYKQYRLYGLEGNQSSNPTRLHQRIQMNMGQSFRDFGRAAKSGKAISPFSLNKEDHNPMKSLVETVCCRLIPAFLATAFSAFLASPSFAQSPAKLTNSATADLLGDGEQEAISVRATIKDDLVADFTLTVGAATITVAQTDDMDECKGLRVVQVNSNSPVRQIIVALSGPDDIEADYLFGFDGSHVFKIGKLDSAAEIPGNGAVYTEQWMDFWLATEKSVVDLRKRRVQNVPQPLYYVGSSTTATASFSLRSEKSGSGEVVAPDSKFQVVAYTPDTPGVLSRGDHGWYLIKTQTGVCGWARLKTFQDKQKGLDFAD